MKEPCDQDQPMVDQPQVAAGNLVGPPPVNPPPPPPGTCMTHADDVTWEWATDDDSINANDANKVNSPADKHEVSDDDISEDEPSSQASEDDASDASEDAISVLAHVAVEEAMEAAVRQAQSPGADDVNQDSINANFAVSQSEQELTSMEANKTNNSPCTRPCSVLGSRPTGSLSQCYHHDEFSDASDEDEGGWRFGENSPPPSLRRQTSGRSPCSASQRQPSDHSDDDDDDESNTLQEVTPPVEPAPEIPTPVTPTPAKPTPVKPALVKATPMTPTPS